MEMQILINGLALPVLFVVAFSITQQIVVFKGRGLYAIGLGFALSVTLLLSAMSQDSLFHFTTQNRWLWFPLAILTCGIITVVGEFLFRTPLLRFLLIFFSSIAAALMLNIPLWNSLSDRFLLGITTAIAALLLNQVIRKRRCFSTIFAMSLGLAAPSVIIVLSGFAKLAVPVGAVAVSLGCISIFRFATQRRTSQHNILGLGGGVVIAAIATISCATGFGFDTNEIPWWIWVIAALAPLGIWLGEIPGVNCRPVTSACLRVVGCVILAALAIWASLSHLSSSNTSSDEMNSTPQIQSQ